MSEKIKEVATALKVSMESSDFVRLTANGPHGEDALNQFFEVLAMDAIEAMREPTQGMIVAAMIQPHPSVDEAGGLIKQGEVAIRIDYQAMIDEALR